MTSSRWRPSATQLAEGLERQVGGVGVVEGGQRLDRAAAAVHVEDGPAVDQDDRCAGRALERPTVVVAPSRPRQRGAVGVRGVGGGEEVHD